MQPALPRIDVVVPVLNAEKTIEACVASIVAQDYPKRLFQVVVVDNGSRDRTPELLRRFEGQVKLLHEPVRGRSAARNRGIGACDGDVVAFVDADCVAAPRWLSALAARLADGRVGMVGGRIRAMAAGHAVQAYGEKIHDHQKAIEVYRPPYVISMNAAVRRAVLDDVGLFDTRFPRGEDVDLSWRIHRAGYGLGYAPGAVVYHHNESTLLGLFREGAAHGYYGVGVKRCHDAYLAALGRTRNRFGNLRRTLSSTRRWLRADTGTGAAFHDAVFNLGKTLGSLAGSVRYRYFEV